MTDVYERMRTVEVDGIESAVTDHGPTNGSAVVLIHGFPDSARLWRHQIPVLVDAGFRVLAPDLRGYGRSAKPTEVEAYDMGLLAGDILAILDDAGIESAHVVGHDWGAALTWYLGLTAPHRTKSLTAISVGHPNAFRSAGHRQREKSWYVLLFQFPGVAERWLSEGDWKGLRSWIGPATDMDLWIDDLSRPGALTAALNLYRANMTPESFVASPRPLPTLDQDVMGVWSTGDLALLESQMTGSAGYVGGEWRYERIEGVSHWIPVDAPDQLNGLLLDWLIGR